MKDITAQRFGRLVAIEPTEERCRGAVVWLCQCDCGGESRVCSNELLRGNIQSCGCWRRESAHKRGVERWGEKHSRHKLTAEQVNDIRHRYAAGFVTQKELAEMFQVSLSNINHITTGRNWQKLPGVSITRMFPVTRAPAIRQRRRIKHRNEGMSMSKK